MHPNNPSTPQNRKAKSDRFLVGQIFTGGKKSGFTLVELLFAATLTVLVVFLVVYTTNSLLRSWNRASSRLEAESRARTSLDYLRRDFESAYFEADGEIWLTAGRDPIAPLYGSSAWLQFFTNSLHDSNGEPGALTAVRYCILSADPEELGESQVGVGGFYRVSTSRERTFREFIGRFEGKTTGDFLAGTTGSGLEPFFLASGILSFEVTLFLETWNDERKQRVTQSIPVDSTHSFPFPDGEIRRPFPSAAEFKLTVLSREGLALLSELAGENRAGPRRDEIVREFGIEVVEFVELRTEGL